MPGQPPIPGTPGWTPGQPQNQGGGNSGGATAAHRKMNAIKANHPKDSMGPKTGQRFTWPLFPDPITLLTFVIPENTDHLRIL